jgi:two-component system, chemotaxis family, sensor kinase CheA
MKGLSVKSKIFLVVVTLSVVTLTTFGYLAFTTYKKDKLAFIYDYLTTEIQSKSSILSSAIGTYDLLLGSIITSVDTNTKSVPSAALKYLQSNSSVIGVYLHLQSQGTTEDLPLYESEETSFKLSAQALKTAKPGPTLLDAKKGIFLFKKALSGEDAYGGIVFANVELADLFSANNGRHTLLMTGSTVDNKSVVTLPVDKDELAQIHLKVDTLKAPYGLFELDIQDVPYFISFSKLPFGKVMVNMIEVQKVMLVQQVFVTQLIIFLVLMTSISLLVGTISARWLTWHLDNLTAAANEMENENFDIHVEVTSGDELGKLGSAFNSMGHKIKSLLEELRIYNLELEQKVADRTKELQELTNIQKAMLNSLGQGFILVDKTFSIGPVYSKIAVDMFEVIPDDVLPTTIMKADETSAQQFEELFQMMSSNALDFDDMAKLFPDFIANSKAQQIQLTYTPIRKEESGELDYMMMIGTDKTAELESMRKFEEEKQVSQMIMKMATNRFSLIKLINESTQMLNDAMMMVQMKAPSSYMHVQRLVHTIKGSFSFYHVTDVVRGCHELESYLNPFLQDEQLDPDHALKMAADVMSIQNSIHEFVAGWESILRTKEAMINKTIALDTLKEFEQTIAQHSPELQEEFAERFYTVPVGPYFETYPGMVKDLNARLNKNVTFLMLGEDVTVPEHRMWDEIFQQFVHVIRNSMDHGIKGKGTIVFEFEKHEQSLRAVLRDNGQGVDWQKIAAKDPSILTEQDALNKIILGGLSSKDEVSEFSGRGVGVSSLCATVKKYGGTITIVNELGKGLQLILDIPFPAKKGLGTLELAA